MKTYERKHESCSSWLQFLLFSFHITRAFSSSSAQRVPLKRAHHEVRDGMGISTHEPGSLFGLSNLLRDKLSRLKYIQRQTQRGGCSACFARKRLQR